MLQASASIIIIGFSSNQEGIRIRLTFIRPGKGRGNSSEHENTEKIH